jgi:hypothetical protein
VSNTANYRAYIFPWKATPSTPPAVSASNRSGQTAVYVSWNGATEVAAWRILAGDRPTSLNPIMTAEKHGFETEVENAARRYVALQALDRKGHLLATSAAVQSS